MRVVAFAPAMKLRSQSLALGLLALSSCATLGTSGESGAVVGAAAVKPHTATDWRELRSEHFTLTTDYDEEDARQIVNRLELLRHALLAAAWGGIKIEGDRTHAVIFETHGEFAEVADENLGGFTRGGARTPSSASGASSRSSASSRTSSPTSSASDSS
jgi:hypothetical protein